MFVWMSFIMLRMRSVKWMIGERTCPGRPSSGSGELQDGGESSVVRVGGEERLFADECEGGIFGQEQLDTAEIFLELEAARGIEERSAGTEHGDRAFQDGVLKDGKLGETRFREAPRDVRPAADDAGVRARHVGEDEIEGLRRKRKFAGICGERLRLDSGSCLRGDI